MGPLVIAVLWLCVDPQHCMPQWVPKHCPTGIHHILLGPAGSVQIWTLTPWHINTVAVHIDSRHLFHRACPAPPYCQHAEWRNSCHTTPEGLHSWLCPIILQFRFDIKCELNVFYFIHFHPDWIMKIKWSIPLCIHCIVIQNNIQ